MKGSTERIHRVVSFKKPDRIPLFDLLPNDAILQEFNGGVPVEPGDDHTGMRAWGAAIDGSRPAQYSPNKEEFGYLEDGRKYQNERWTSWTEPERQFISSEEYRERKTQELAGWEDRLEKTGNLGESRWYQELVEQTSWFGDDFYFVMGARSPSLMGIWHELGLEGFSYVFHDCEDVIIEQLERNTVAGCMRIAGLPEGDRFEMVFIGEDIAFKTAPMINPQWTRKHYFPRLKRIIDAYHAKKKKVMFHSDGNLNLIMDDLVEAGIDALNPIEVLAGMDLADLHRRYPRLIFAGGIDVSQLLPFGTPQQVKDAVVKAIEVTEGQILVGSSTEVQNCVPLENFLTMREATMNYRL